MPIDAVLIGAGGFGREVLDVIEAHNRVHGIDSEERIRILGVVDDAPSELNLKRLDDRGYLHLGGISELLREYPSGRYLLGVGDPNTKRKIAEALEKSGWSPVTVIHPNAVIGSVQGIGQGSIICGGVQLSTNTLLGRHVHLNPSVTIGHDAVLNDYVSVNPGAIVSGEVTVGTGTLIGAGATILQGLSIGDRALVGACACVTRKVDNEILVVGVPARPHLEVSGS
ncbi:acetyltransferase [Paeniglutamicibacter sp.]|uniref:acetyltransferase n=1 Tax=Paeniglutamicibacter sp. TaxID=1934391 RepID=UPI003988D8D3